MIAHLSGTLASKAPNLAVVDVGGIGYAVQIASTTYDRLPATDRPVKLFTFLAVRENALDLYGFMSTVERDLFLRVIEVNGVGPKLALSILSAMDPAEFRLAIVSEDMRTLSRIRGVGKKTAERLVIELRESFQQMGFSMGDGGDGATVQAVPGDPASQAVAALVGLGLRAPEVARVVKEATEKFGPDATTEQLVKEALKRM